MSSKTINPNIATEAPETDKFRRDIVFFNIANSENDSKFNPLGSRIRFIIDEINKLSPSLLFLLEGGRPSEGLSWTEIAAMIEKATGLIYWGIDMLNASEKSFGKAIFYNPSLISIGKIARYWPEHDSRGNHFGSSVTILTCCPVTTFTRHTIRDGITTSQAFRQVVVNRQFRVAAAHFPVNQFGQTDAAIWINRNYEKFDVIGGDFNTFSGGSGAKNLAIILKNFHLQECLPEDTAFTFSAFPHDVVSVPNAQLDTIGPHSKIVETDETHSKVLFSSWLDHVFSHPSFYCIARVAPLTPASDHAPIVASICI